MVADARKVIAIPARAPMIVKVPYAMPEDDSAAATFHTPAPPTRYVEVALGRMADVDLPNGQRVRLVRKR